MSKLHGAWSLRKFQIRPPEGEPRDWGEGQSGLLIYSADGYMSVSINRRPTSDDPKGILDSLLFYSGTFEVKDGSILHNVQNASDPSRIGKQMIRHFELDGLLLKLRSDKQSFGVAELIWEKIT